MTFLDDSEGGLLERPLDVIGASANWFEAQLASRGFALVGGSAMLVALATLRDFRAKVIAGNTLKFASGRKTFDYFAESTGADFVTKAIHWGSESGLVLPDERWKLLRSGDPLITRPSEKTSMERNLTWEIVIASLAATFATDVAFNEPDVTCNFNGSKFAIAAKVAYSDDKVVPNILKGFDQAEGKADISLVLVDVVSLYPQVANFEFSISRGYGGDDRAARDMKGAVTRWVENWPLETLRRSVQVRTTKPLGVIFFVPMLVQVKGVPSPFPYVHMPLTWAGDGGVDYQFARAFLGACNHVLGFAPASA